MNETVVVPDLSALPRDVRVRIAVAETQGATWEQRAGEYGRIVWHLSAEAGVPGEERLALTIVHIHPNGHVDAFYLPHYLTDPAAWGPLLEMELDAIECCVTTNRAATRARLWRGQWTLGDDTFPAGSDKRERGPWELSIGAAVCSAVLEKYGVDWQTLELVG